MRFTKYSKWTGQSWDDLSLEELMDALSGEILAGHPENIVIDSFGQVIVIDWGLA